MDANRFRLWAASLGLLILCGCMVDSPYPTARPEKAGDSTRRPKEPPQVVDTPPTEKPETADDQVLDSVIEYIQQVDDARTRGENRPGWQAHDDGVARQVADTELDPGPPPISLLPIDPNELPPTSAPTDGETDEPTEEAAPTTQAAAPAKPQLGTVAVRAATDVQAVPAEPGAPGVNATAVASFAGPSSLREFLEHVPLPEDASFREQVDQRMLWVIAGEYDRAREPLTLATTEQQELAARFVDAWIAIREGHLGDEGAAATEAARELATLQDSLRRLSDLRIPVVYICSAVRGFGQYDAVEPARFFSGAAAEFVLYCEVADFVSEHRDDGNYYTIFDMTCTVLNRAGDVVLQLKDADIVDRCRNRRADCFIPRLVRLPATLSPGRYVAKVTIVDKLGEKVAENSAAFELVARP